MRDAIYLNFREARRAPHFVGYKRVPVLRPPPLSSPQVAHKNNISGIRNCTCFDHLAMVSCTWACCSSLLRPPACILGVGADFPYLTNFKIFQVFVEDIRIFWILLLIQFKRPASIFPLISLKIPTFQCLKKQMKLVQSYFLCLNFLHPRL